MLNYFLSSNLLPCSTNRDLLRWISLDKLFTKRIIFKALPMVKLKSVDVSKIMERVRVKKCLTLLASKRSIEYYKCVV